MIGTNVRGFRHLWRLSDSSLREMLVNFREHGFCLCHVMKTKPDSPVGERLIIFNPYHNLGRNHGSSTYTTAAIMGNEAASFVARRYPRAIEFEKAGLGLDFPYIAEMTILPVDFEEQYSKFLSTNAKMIRTLTNKFRYDPSNEFSKRAFMYTDGSKNFYQWAINTYFQNGTSMSSIKNIMLWNETYGQMAKNLRKNTITAYTSDSDIMSLSEELILLRRDKRINDSINMFNTAQKRILRAAQLSDKDKDTFSKFYRLSETKKVNFVRKMSTIEDFDEIMRQMRHITSTHFDWNKDSFMDFIANVEGMKYETIYDNGDIVLIKVEDYETVKNLAKTTNWCISKNKTYWNQYVEHRIDSTQYMVFDFSKKEDDLLSIIGFTTEYNKGITHAHDFTNNDMMRTGNSIDTQFLNSFISKFANSRDIYSVLKDCGIDINMVAQYDKPLFEWNKESMFKYLFECVNKNNVDVLCDEGNKVAISVRDKNIRYFLGDAYIDNINDDSWGWQHIIFMDFDMSAYNPNRLQFAIIRNGGYEQEDYCNGFYNEHMEGANVSFDTKLSQYNLPYNIIRRPDNKFIRVSSAFQSLNAPMFKSLIKGMSRKDLQEVIYDYIGSDTTSDKISQTIVGAMSFDMLDAFYDNGFKLVDVMDKGPVGRILKDLANNILVRGRNIGGQFLVPTGDEINKFFSNDCDSIDQTFYIGLYLAMKKIIAKEKRKDNNNSGMYKRIVSIFLMQRVGTPLFDEILLDIADQISFKESSEVAHSWVSYANVYGGEAVKKYTMDNLMKYNFVKSVWNDLEKRKGNLVGTTETRGEDNVAIELNIPPMDDYEDEDDELDFLDDRDEEFDGDGALIEEEAPAEAF